MSGHEDRELLEAIMREMLTNLLAVCDAKENDAWKVGFIRSAVKNALKELDE